MARAKKTSLKEDAPELKLSPEEVKAILAYREKQLAGPTNDEVEEIVSAPPAERDSVGIEILAKALTQALKDAQPPQRKTVFNRVKRTPWSPKDGSPKILKFRRPMYHHGIPMNPKRTLNEDIELLDKVRPGIYCDGHVRVTKRKDGGIDIDYPIRTASQRLKLVNQFRITSLNDLLQRLVDERADPRKYKSADELDD